MAWQLRAMEIALGGVLPVEFRQQPQQTDIEDLPEEVLEKIFGKLPLKSQLSCRQVTKRWNRIVEGVLEAETLSNFTRWTPNDRNEYGHQFVIFVGTPWPTTNDNTTEDAFLTEYSSANYSLICSFCKPILPKALHVCIQQLNHEDDHFSPDYEGVRLVDFFRKVGHNLTILQLDSLSLKLDTLINILINTSNLKALSLYDIHLCVGCKSCKKCILKHFPCLPRLKTLVVDYRDIRGVKTTSETNTWIVKAYGAQLESLDALFEPTEQQLLSCFPLTNLKNLKILYPTAIFPAVCPTSFTLERLALTIGSSGRAPKGDQSIFLVFDFVDKHCRSLVYFSLDLCWHKMIIQDEETKSLYYIASRDSKEFQTKRSRDPTRIKLISLNGRLPTSRILFPKLKTLAISYPIEDVDMLLLKMTILPKFPNLEVLYLLHFGNGYRGKTFNIEPASIPEFLRNENYWHSCPLLKKITVVRYNCVDERHYDYDREFICMVKRPQPKA